MSFKRNKSHYNSHVIVDKALYYTSEDDLDMVGCFFALHDTSEFPKKKIKPIVDLLELGQSVQSASS